MRKTLQMPRISTRIFLGKNFLKFGDLLLNPGDLESALTQLTGHLNQTVGLALGYQK